MMQCMKTMVLVCWCLMLALTWQAEAFHLPAAVRTVLHSPTPTTASATSQSNIALSMNAGGFFAFFQQKPSSNNNNAKRLQEIQDKKQQLVAAIAKCPMNGVNTKPSLVQEVDAIARELEALNPTTRPAYSDKMNGFWRLLYSDFSPAAPSSGKLGPFIGEVFQDLRSDIGEIRNILRINFPPVQGGLVARQSIRDPQTWQIEFDRVNNRIAGIPLRTKKFKPMDQIRLWKITYLDEDFRIMRARRPETSEDKSFIFILRRDEQSRFDIDI